MCAWGWSLMRAGGKLFFLGLDELTVIGRIEIKQRPTRSKMLHENLADHVGGAGGEHRHCQRADCRSYSGKALHEAAHTHRGGRRSARRDHRSCQAGYDRFASIFGKWNAVNFGKAA